MTDLDTRMMDLEAIIRSRNPPTHNWPIILTEMILIFCVGIMIALILMVLNGQSIGRQLVRDSMAQNQRIINHQEIMAANLKWANAMIHARCATGVRPLAVPLPYDKH